MEEVPLRPGILHRIADAHPELSMEQVLRLTQLALGRDDDDDDERGGEGGRGRAGGGREDGDDGGDEEGEEEEEPSDEGEDAGEEERAAARARRAALRQEARGARARRAAGRETAPGPITVSVEVFLFSFFPLSLPRGGAGGEFERGREGGLEKTQE